MNNFLRKLNFQITLIAGDVFSVILAFVVAFFIREFLSHYITIPALISNDPLDYQLTNWWIIPLYVGVFFMQGLYTERRPFWQETRVLIKCVVISSLLMYTIISLGQLSPSVSRLIFILHPFIVICFLPLVRRFIKIIMFRLGSWATPIIEIKVDTEKSLKEIWQANMYIGYEIIKSIKLSLNSTRKIQEIEDELRPFIKKYKIETISVVTKDINDKKLSHLIEKLYFLAPQLIITPEFMTFDVINADVYHLMYENMFVFDIKKGLISRTNQVLKRLTDIIISFVGIVLTLPLMIIIALAIYLLDGGPAVYAHERYGKNGKIFKFMKFRSMSMDNERLLADYLKKNPDKEKEWKSYQKLKGYDPRLIKGIGWFLRRFDLDELPQLFNVLAGDMSLVGPRPYLPRERDMIGMYFERILSVKPGITGLWQATGRNDFTFKQRLDIDTWYIQNWSMWLDFVITFKTIKKILS